MPQSVLVSFSLSSVMSRDSMFIDGQFMPMATKQLSIVAPTKRRVHGKLQKDVKVCVYVSVCLSVCVCFLMYVIYKLQESVKECMCVCLSVCVKYL